MIRLLLVDDHPAMRAGLTAVLRAEPGMVPLARPPRAEEPRPAVKRTKPDVVLLDYHLPGSDGLRLCRRSSACAARPRCSCTRPTPTPRSYPGRAGRRRRPAQQERAGARAVRRAAAGGARRARRRRRASCWTTPASA